MGNFLPFILVDSGEDFGESRFHPKLEASNDDNDEFPPRFQGTQSLPLYDSFEIHFSKQNEAANLKMLHAWCMMHEICLSIYW